MNVLATSISAILFVSLCAGCDFATHEPEPEPEKEMVRSYTKSVLREAENELEESLIAKAEAIYPNRDSVVAAALEPERIPESGFWYYAGFGRVLLPYAITADAVAYYSNLIDALSNGDAAANLKTIYRATFDYRAGVAFRQAHEIPASDRHEKASFERVYVVELSLVWSEGRDLGEAVGMTFWQDRIVVFNEAGEALGVFLDGPTIIAVT